MALVLDTGVVYAALYEDDPDHDPCVDLINSNDEQLVIPESVLVEVDYWLRKAASPEVWLTFCEDIARGAYTLWSVSPQSLMRISQLQERFSDQPVGFVDACVFIACETLGEDKVATLDHRHFSVLRTEGGESLRLLPD